MVRGLKTAAVAALAAGGAAAEFQDKWEKFCGVPDCYTELGLFPNATKAQIRRAYRQLSLEFHPDKNPGDDTALKRFNKVARANEVLTNDEQRKKLDYYTENPGEYWSLYGSFIEAVYAPKTDVKIALLILLLFAAILQPTLQINKHQQYKSAFVKAALAKLPVAGGGSAEALQLRAEADVLLKEKLAARKKAKKTKLTGPEEKALLKETLGELADKATFPPEFAYPTLADNLLYKAVTWPKKYMDESSRKSGLAKKAAAGEDLTEDEAQEVIEGYLGGADAWDELSAGDQHALLKQKCYVKANFDAWAAKAAEPSKSPRRKKLE
jgi:curved DNA-binding protein CbpA